MIRRKKILFLALLVVPVIAAELTMVYFFWHQRKDVTGLLTGIIVVFLAPFAGNYLRRRKK